MRGAAWNSTDPDYLLASLRLPYTPELRYYYLDFRVVLVGESRGSPRFVSGGHRFEDPSPESLHIGRLMLAEWD